jgi:hypothetical protein
LEYYSGLTKVIRLKGMLGKIWNCNMKGGICFVARCY